MRTDMCTGMCIGVCMDMCVDVCVDMFIDMSMDICMDRLPDSGKSTILRRVYGLNVRCGLQKHNCTRTVSIHSHPEIPHVLLFDEPGIGDRIQQRNDIVELIARLAERSALSKVMRIIHVNAAGRRLENRMTDLLPRFPPRNVLPIITHTDKVL